jgi:hypothetical protein
MKAIIFSSVLAVASAHYTPVFPANDGYIPQPVPLPTPIYKPVHPHVPVVQHHIAPQAPVVVAPVPTTTVTVIPAPTKLPTTMTCKKWNKLANDDECEFVAKTKCTTKPSKKSKYEECSEETCCLEEPEAEEVSVATVATVPAKATATIISCAQFCGQNSLQCQVAVEGSCAVEGPFGQYSQCSKELCCRQAAPVLPKPQIVSCKAVVAGNGWNCGYVPKFGCSLTGPSGNYPACTYDVCCAHPGPVDPVDPCEFCNLPYAYCPSHCSAANSGYAN